MNHIEVWQYETHRPASEELWFAWCNQVERILGDSLDGDEASDGYSLDSAYEAFVARITPTQYCNGQRA